MFDGILNTTLSEVSPNGATQANSPNFLILLIYNKHKTIRWNFGLTPSFYSPEREFTSWVDKAKNMWLIFGQLPVKAGWWDAALALRILAETINKTIFPSNTAVTFIVFNDST